MSLTIVDPAAYTDYAQDDALAAQQLRAAGIDATFQGLSVNAWNADVASGDFQLTMHWSNGGITPYNMYDGWLDSALASGSSADRRLRAAERRDGQRRPRQAQRRLHGLRAGRRPGADREVRRARTSR